MAGDADPGEVDVIAGLEVVDQAHAAPGPDRERCPVVVGVGGLRGADEPVAVRVEIVPGVLDEYVALLEEHRRFFSPAEIPLLANDHRPPSLVLRQVESRTEAELLDAVDLEGEELHGSQAAVMWAPAGLDHGDPVGARGHASVLIVEKQGLQLFAPSSPIVGSLDLASIGEGEDVREFLDDG